MMQLFGLFAGCLFAYAAVPAAFRVYKYHGKSPLPPLDITVAIFFGTLTMYSYLLLAYGFNWVLTLNYGVEAGSWGVLLYYGVKRR